MKLFARLLCLFVCLTPSSPHAQHENMISASVEVVGAVCRRLTWSKYLYYLKHFIHILQTAQTEQKLAVRWGFLLISHLLFFSLSCFLTLHCFLMTFFILIHDSNVDIFY